MGLSVLAGAITDGPNSTPVLMVLEIPRNVATLLLKGYRSKSRDRSDVNRGCNIRRTIIVENITVMRIPSVFLRTCSVHRVVALSRDFVLALIDVTLIGVFGASLDGRRARPTAHSAYPVFFPPPRASWVHGT